MVTHFRNLEAHRRGVLSIYRTLLRHTTNLKQIEGSDDSKVGTLVTYIKDRFRHQKPQMSTAVVRRWLLKAHESEEVLRGLYGNFEPRKYAGLVNMAETHYKELEKKRQRRPLTNRFGQPIKRDLDNVQDLEMQKITNYVNRYVRVKQRKGELPKRLDPEMVEEIIKPEALHYRALMDVKRARQKVAGGAYKVHITTSNGIGFVRGPWRQSKRISPMILRHVKGEQDFFDFQHYADANGWLYKAEDQWEGLTGTRDGMLWEQSLAGSINGVSDELNVRRKYYADYKRQKLPLQLARLQPKSDFIHKTIAKRFAGLREEMAGVTPFDEMINRPTLRQLVRKYRFLS